VLRLPVVHQLIINTQGLIKEEHDLLKLFCDGNIVTDSGVENLKPALNN